MQSRCKHVRASMAWTGLSILTALSLFAPSVSTAAPLTGDDESTTGNSSAGSLFVAQRQESGSSGQDNGSSGMSERIRKYMGEGEPGGGDSSQRGRGEFGQRGGEMESRRQRMRQKLMEMSPEDRKKFIQKMRQQRGEGGGNFSGGDGMGMPPPGGPDGRPPFPPPGGERGFPGDGGPPGFGDGGPDDGPPFGPPGGPPGERFGGSGGRFGGPGQGGHKTVRNYGSSSKSGGGKQWFGRSPLDLTVLNLTQEQKTQIQAMRTKNGQKVKAIHSSLRDRRDRFKDMLFDPSASNEQILAERKEISKLQAQAEDVMLNDFLSIRKLLTKEQMSLLPQVRPEEHHPPRPMMRPAHGNKKSGDPEISDRPPNFD